MAAASDACTKQSSNNEEGNECSAGFEEERGRSGLRGVGCNSECRGRGCGEAEADVSCRLSAVVCVRVGAGE